MKRQWARNTLVFVPSRYANAFLRYCILNVFFLHAEDTVRGYLAADHQRPWRQDFYPGAP